MSDTFTALDEVVAPGEAGSTYHLLDWQTGSLITPAWSGYLAAVRAAHPLEGGVDTGARRVTTVLSSECFPGDRLRRGIRVLGRSARTFTFEVVLWQADTGVEVVRSEIVMVTVDRKSGTAVQIPAGFWAGVEEREGRSIAPVARS